MLNCGNHQARPALVPEKWLSAFGLCRDEVGVFIASNCLSPRTHPIPSGAKAPLLLLVYVRAEARTLQAEAKQLMRQSGLLAPKNSGAKSSALSQL
jgi:hypothetical protein